jgi:transmembrane sensor
MSMEHRPGPKGSGNQFLDEAADWFARMRGPEADLHIEEFEQWLRRGALHRAAYNRVAEIFAMGRGLTSDARQSSDAPTGSSPRTWVKLALPVCFALMAATATWATFRVYTAHAPGSADAPTHAGLIGRITTAVGEIRTIRLADGSSLILDTDSLVFYDLAGGARKLYLVRGRARFNVAHDGRPFQVQAGSGAVTAHGTMFDVRVLRNSRIAVRLIRGKIDVSLPHATGEYHLKSSVRHMLPGEALQFSNTFYEADPISGENSESWTRGMADFDAATLRDVVAESNRYSDLQIIAGSASVASLKISGRFAINDTGRVAAHLASLFDLDVDQSEPGHLILRQKVEAIR